MTPADLDALARDLESQGRFAEADQARQLIVSAPVSAEVGREVREAEAVGDWRRWAELLQAGSEPQGNPS